MQREVMTSTVTCDASPGSGEASLAPGTKVRAGTQIQGPFTELGQRQPTGLYIPKANLMWTVRTGSYFFVPGCGREKAHILVLVIRTQHLF